MGVSRWAAGRRPSATRSGPSCGQSSCLRLSSQRPFRRTSRAPHPFPRLERGRRPSPYRNSRCTRPVRKPSAPAWAAASVTRTGPHRLRNPGSRLIPMSALRIHSRAAASFQRASGAVSSSHRAPPASACQRIRAPYPAAWASASFQRTAGAVSAVGPSAPVGGTACALPTARASAASERASGALPAASSGGTSGASAPGAASSGSATRARGASASSAPAERGAPAGAPQQQAPPPENNRKPDEKDKQKPHA